jgi:site-specific DNA recombinase
MSAASTGGRTRIVCTRMHESGTCENRRYYYLDGIERRVIDGLRSKFGTREAIAYFVDVYNAERKRASNATRRQSVDLERKLGLAERDLKRAIDGMIRGTISEAEGDHVIPELRRQRDHVKATVASAAKPPKLIELHPPSVDEYLRAIERLADYANGHLAKSDDELAQSLRRFIDSVTVMPAGPGEEPEIKVAGALASLLPLESKRSGLPGAVVAGAGIEPATYGL